MLGVHNPGRHTVLTYVSDDEYGTSLASATTPDIIDLGRSEATMAALWKPPLSNLKDGTVWMLLSHQLGSLLTSFFT